ncbi:MAG: protein-disulfide reductase DsbD domain-containing protein [Candidatus Acidiferrales bacterium]
MPTNPRQISVTLLASLFVACFFLAAQHFALAQDALPKPAAVVKPATYVSLEPVPRGKTFEVAIVVEIVRGFHMNSHKPSDAYLIPTTLTPQAPAGFEVLDTIYPDGHDEKFAFSPKKPLNVYTGTVTLKLKLSAHADAALGAATIPITLRYQACNDTTCLQPVKVPVDAKFEVAAAGAKSHAAHTDVFAAAPPKS